LRTLVVFYSYEGNTRLIAGNIAQMIDADLLEIKPQKEMRSKGIMRYFFGGLQVLFGSKPPLKEFDKEPNEYDIIFIGTPVWFYRQTPTIRTFMEDHLSKKHMLAFFCSYEGDLGKTFVNMNSWASGNEVLGEKAFFAPLKKDQLKTIRSAREWALSLMESLE
jgi:flavodoxin